MAGPLPRLAVRTGLAALVAAVVFGFEPPAHASEPKTEPLQRITFDTSSLALGATVFGEYDDFRKNYIQYGTGLGVAYDALFWRHLSIGVTSDWTMLWGHLDEEDPDGGYRTRALESLLRVELTAGVAWWAGSSWRVDHQLGLGPCLVRFAYDADVEGIQPGLVGSLRTLVNWRAWNHFGLVGGPVVTVARPRGGGDVSITLLVTELRLGLSWEPM